eukprot:scaffold272224_cov26-Prasinocladus_malaysianus.AAC.1
MADGETILWSNGAIHSGNNKGATDSDVISFEVGEYEAQATSSRLTAKGPAKPSESDAEGLGSA